MVKSINKITIAFCLITFLSILSWGQSSISVKGDLRFRTERIQEEQTPLLETSDRIRSRIRLRLGSSFKVNSQSEVNVRLSTGTTSASESTSTNQDLTDYEARKAVVIDLAYFHHKASEDLVFMGGKTPNPFLFVGGNDLVFDNDINLEGIASQLKKKLEQGELLFNLAGSWLSERFSATGTNPNADVGFFGAQLAYKFKNEDLNAAITLSSYQFSNVKGASATVTRGNTTSGGNYVNDYNLTSIGASIGTDLQSRPLTAYAESVTNSEADQYNTGIIYGIKYGLAKEPYTWSFAIDHRELKSDAVLGVLTESDVAGGGTDIRSIRANAIYQLAENTSLALTYFNGDKSISSTTLSPNHTRYWVDLNFNF